MNMYNAITRAFVQMAMMQRFLVHGKDSSMCHVARKLTACIFQSPLIHFQTTAISHKLLTHSVPKQHFKLINSDPDSTSSQKIKC